MNARKSMAFSDKPMHKTVQFPDMLLGKLDHPLANMECGAGMKEKVGFEAVKKSEKQIIDMVDIRDILQ